ncbi:hypothetical protein C0J52_03566 [Blattella germanica]|nr:hypothetical protein C0J52_03566 [Blattella germanica]
MTGKLKDHKVCRLCGKQMRRASLKRHIKDQHFPSERIPCDTCGKIFKNNTSLQSHKNIIHKQFKKGATKQGAEDEEIY